MGQGAKSLEVWRQDAGHVWEGRTLRQQQGPKERALLVLHLPWTINRDVVQAYAEEVTQHMSCANRVEEYSCPLGPR
eukprot:1669267-Amphidinium_carterae.1